MRKTWVAVVAVLLSAAVPAPARAGGAVLDLNQDFFLPGDSVRAFDAVWLKSSMGRLEDGPYFAFLSRIAPRMPPPLPRDALRVARVEVAPWPDDRWGDASVEFVMPPVEPGRYWLTVCNRRCSTTLGDLVSAELLVAEDADAGRFAVLREELSGRIDGIQYQLRDRVLGHRAESLRSRVMALERDVERLAAELDQVRAEGAAHEPAPVEDESSALTPLLAFVVPAALAGAFLGRRSRAG